MFQLISILLKKFCVTDHPNKFQLFEEYKADGRADGMCSVTSAVLEIMVRHWIFSGHLSENFWFWSDKMSKQKINLDIVLFRQSVLAYFTAYYTASAV